MESLRTRKGETESLRTRKGGNRIAAYKEGGTQNRCVQRRGTQNRCVQRRGTQKQKRNGGKRKKRRMPLFSYASMGLYFGTSSFMMHQPMR